jgi:hypothetical protein
MWCEGGGGRDHDVAGLCHAKHFVEVVSGFEKEHRTLDDPSPAGDVLLESGRRAVAGP